MNYEEKLNILKDNLEKSKDLKNRAEIKLESLYATKKDLIEQIKQYGVEPENLNSEIDKLKNEIDDLLDRADKLMPKD
ncbi:Hypothetical protein ING2D1G_0781 [Peptoniphilus sp. ING2-D1G]|nr:Hypothetical protein ING2D1G_0781 [Peptoniphilus sp. ING2-D1G]